MTLPKNYLKYPKRKHGQDHDFYEWRLSENRPKINWPDDAKVVVSFIVPLEFFSLNPSGIPFKHPGAMVTPYPDLRHFTVRDYGNRVGIFRILETLDKANVRATFPMNGEIHRRYPPLIHALKHHEIASHGFSTDHIHHEGLSQKDEERLIFNTKYNYPRLLRLVADVPDTQMLLISGDPTDKPKIDNIGEGDQGYTGKDGEQWATCYFKTANDKSEWQVEVKDSEVAIINKSGWLSPTRNQSTNTLNLLAKNGFDYCLDWEMDQVPVIAKTKNGNITLIPNSYELSDFTLLHTRRQTEEAWLKQIQDSVDLLLEEHDRFGGQMLGLTLTPYVIGQPFRIWALRALLHYLKEKDGVAIMTAGEIATHFKEQA